MVGNTYRHLCLTADGQNLFNRFNNVDRLITHVRTVDAAVRGNNFCQFNDFPCAGIAAWRVDKAGGQAGGAVFHRVFEQSLHPLKLLVRAVPVVKAHNRHTQRAVANKELHVRRFLLFFAVIHVGLVVGPFHHLFIREVGCANHQHSLNKLHGFRVDRCHGKAALPGHFRGNTL